MNNLWYFKLSNGDEIVSETLPSDDSEYYLLSNPLEIKDIVDERSGITAVILQDYCPYTNTKTSIRLSKMQVVSHAICSGGMCDYYNASLEYLNLHGADDTETKIKRAADRLKLYNTKLDDQKGALEQIYEELIEDVPDDEEEYWSEEDLYTTTATANTTFH